jgi:O-antigen/teichoic acid export membrane protein
MKKQILSGGIWLGLGSGTEYGLRFFRNMILARLLFPEAFGKLAIVMAIINFFETISQLGIKESIIQNKFGNEKEFLNGAFFINFGRGVVLYIIGFCIAPLFALFYHDPDLKMYLWVSFLNILLLGFFSPRAFLSLKNMNYRSWAIINHVGASIGILATILLAYQIKSVWALIFGYLFENIGRLALSHIIAPYWPSFKLRKEFNQALFKYSKEIFGLPFLQFLYSKLDIFILGKTVPTKTLGVYSLVQSLALIPIILFENIVTQIILPVFSKLQNNREELRRVYKKMTLLFLSALFTLLSLCVVFAHPLISLAYGREYLAGTTIFQLLCLCYALRLSGTIGCGLFLATGKPSIYRMTSLIRLVVLALCIFPLIHFFGVTGAPLALLVSLIVWIFLMIRKISANFAISFFSQAAWIVLAALPALAISACYFSWLFFFR